MSGAYWTSRDIDRRLEKHLTAQRIFHWITREAAIAGPFAGSWTGSERSLARMMRLDPRAVQRSLAILAAEGAVTSRPWCPVHGPKAGDPGLQVRRDGRAQLVTQLCPQHCPQQMRQLIPLDDVGYPIVRAVSASASAPASAPARAPVSGDSGERESGREEGASPLSAVPASEPAEPTVVQESASPRKRTPKAPKPDEERKRPRWVEELTARFVAEYARTHGGARYPFVGGRDGVGQQRLAEQFTETDGPALERAVVWALGHPNDFYRGKAQTLVRFAQEAQELIGLSAAVPSRNGHTPTREEKVAEMIRQANEAVAREG